MRFRLAVFMCVALCLVLSNIYGKSKSPVQGKASRSMASRPVSMKSPRGRPYLPDRVIVKVKLSRGFAKKTGMFGLPSLDLFAQRYSVESVSEMFPGHATLSTSGQVDLARICVMKYSAPMEAWKVAQELSSRPDVEYAEPWYIYPVESCPSNDSLRNQQWALTKIMADSAWCISQGDTSVIIGNIDTGVKWDHPDLAANIWANPGETGLDSLGRDKRFNGVDDDGDGYIDDWHGWDFGGAS